MGFFEGVGFVGKMFGVLILRVFFMGWGLWWEGKRGGGKKDWVFGFFFMGFL